MKQKVTRMGLALALAAAISPQAFSADPLFNFTFDDADAFNSNFTVKNNNVDDYTWKYNYYGSTYNYAQCYYWNANNTYDDYMTTVNAYSLQPGKAYRLRYQAWHDQSSASVPGKMVIAIGTGDDVLAYTTIEDLQNLEYINKYNGVQGKWYDTYFTVPEAGDYRFTFHAVDGAGASIDNITLQEYGSPACPAAVEAVTVTPGENFATTATVSFTLPSKTITGGDLTSVTKVEIMRNGTLATTLTSGLTPGSEQMWNDANAGTGTITYAVKVFSGDLESELTEGSAYVGPLTPKPVTALGVTSDNDRDFTISWTAPTKSTNDMALDASLLKYNVYRVVGENAEKIADAITETTATDVFAPATATTFSYKVEAVYGTEVSEAVASEEFSVGPNSLPLAASFRGAKMDAGWKSEKISGSYNWETTSSSSSPSASSQDGDGGLVYYKSFSAPSGQGARLISPEIKNEAGSNPAFSYYLYHYTSGKDQVLLEVQKDGGEWEEVPNTTNTVQGSPTGWTLYSYSLADAVAGSTSYRVALRTISAYGYNTVVDNIKIYNQLAHDAEVKSVSGPESIVAGNEATFTVALANNGSSAIAADDYQLLFTVGDRQVETPASVEIPVNATVNIEVPVLLTAADAAEEALEVKADAVYAADLDADNNSATTSILVTTSGNPAPLNLQGQANDAAITLTWECPVNSEGYVPTDFSENFETLDNWTIIDRDGDTSMAVRYGWKSTEWTIPDFGDNSYAPSTSDGNIVGVSLAKAGNSDDWLISPELQNPFDGAVYKVTFKALTMESYVKLSIKYSTTDAQPDSFTEAESVSLEHANSSSDWKTFTATVPGSAKYIALHNCNLQWETNNFILIDKVQITSEMTVVNGYHVYEEGARLNGDMLTETSYVIPLTEARSGANERSFAVSAVYAEGESPLTDLVTVSIPTGLDNILSDMAGIRVLRGGISVPSFARVYGIGGTQVASGEGFISLSRGLYVVTLNGKAYKVMVK